MFSFRYWKIAQILASIKQRNWAVKNKIVINAIEYFVLGLIATDFIILGISMANDSVGEEN